MIARQLRVGMNLCYLRPGEVGGSETYVRQLVRQLAERDDVQLTLFCHGDCARTFESTRGARVVVTSWHPYSAVRRLLDENLRLAVLTRVHQCDVLFSPANFGAPLLPTRLPQVVTVHDFQHDALPHNFSRATRLARTGLFRASFHRAQHIIAISQYTRSAALRDYGVPDHKISAIHEGATEEVIVDAATARRTQRAHGLSEPYVLYPAMAAPHKNHEVLLEAFAQAVAGGSQLRHLVFTGKHSHHSRAIRERTEELGLGDRVHTLGFVSRQELWELLSGATALAFPSRFEGFGLPVLEAMLVGVPVIASTAASIPEIAGDAALMVHPDDVGGWADALTRLTEDRELQRDLIARGKDRVAGFTWSLCADRTVEVLRRAAGRD